MLKSLQPDILFVLDDKLGGISSLHKNLLSVEPGKRGLPCRVLFIDERESKFTKYGKTLSSDPHATFRYSNKGNKRTLVKRLNRVLAVGTGAVVSSGSLELEALAMGNVKRTSYQLVHDEYNVSLSERFHPVVDVFITHSQGIYELLKRKLPERVESIHYLPYGIVPVPRRRNENTARLRLIFIGRMQESKGIFDLPIIDELLKQAHVDVSWTVIGNGPERARLMESWRRDSDRVQFLTPDTTDEVYELCMNSDVFVFPTRFEGFPVALLEAMSAGLVPVVSDLPTGIPEVVHDGLTGFKVPIGDCQAFAHRIQAIDQDRQFLERASDLARSKVLNEYDTTVRSLAYFNVFCRWSELKTRSEGHESLVWLSRLDQKWFPNWLVYSIRSMSSRPAYREAR